MSLTTAAAVYFDISTQVYNFEITSSLIATSLSVARMCVRCPVVDLNITDSEGRTSIMLAIEQGNFAVVETLLQPSVLEDSRIDIDLCDVCYAKV